MLGVMTIQGIKICSASNGVELFSYLNFQPFLYHNQSYFICKHAGLQYICFSAYATTRTFFSVTRDNLFHIANQIFTDPPSIVNGHSLNDHSETMHYWGWMISSFVQVKYGCPHQTFDQIWMPPSGVYPNMDVPLPFLNFQILKMHTIYYLKWTFGIYQDI